MWVIRTMMRNTVVKGKMGSIFNPSNYRRYMKWERAILSMLHVRRPTGISFEYSFFRWIIRTMMSSIVVKGKIVSIFNPSDYKR